MRFPLLFLIFSLSTASLTANTSSKITQNAAPLESFQSWEFTIETGALWSFGNDATPLNYTFLPQLLTFKSPYIFKKDLSTGSTLVLRNRLSMMGQAVIEGPESYFFGVSGTGLLEWWNSEQTCAWFLSAGGGIGWLDSQGYKYEGAQGQDFNYQWIIYSGIRIHTQNQLHLSLGLYFQHISNRGENAINPGVNALGPMVSFGWNF